MASRERQIVESLASLLSTLAWVKVVETENVKAATAYADHELPAIQIYDGESAKKHEMTRIIVTMDLTVELILKPSAAGAATQGLLFDRMEEIETLVGANLTLGLGFMEHLVYVRSRTDVHKSLPHLVGQLDFAARFRKPFTGTC